MNRRRVLKRKRVMKRKRVVKILDDKFED